MANKEKNFDRSDLSDFIILVVCYEKGGVMKQKMLAVVVGCVQYPLNILSIVYISIRHARLRFCYHCML